ncbi:monooxygenase [Backusella circina FSU 941]|nr:monooxygenase [Backusella circina FSU 941]
MTKPTVAIIGTGFSGLGSAIQLKKQMNIDADLFEITKDIGGTWNYNTYPGAACDIPSHLYSFSYELNPNWSMEFSKQKEIHEYLKGVARKYHIYERTQFETEVIRATWLEDMKKWEVELNRYMVKNKENEIRYYDFIFSGVGGLRIPNIPKEYTSFEGKLIHSAEWDNSYDYNDKRVAIIGNGASAVQIIPNLAPSVKQLYSFQRTPSWVVPREVKSYSKFIRTMFYYFPIIMYFYRAYIFFARDMNFNMWKKPHSRLAVFAREQIIKFMKHSLSSNGRDDLAESLIPDFPVGCKRITPSPDYLPALCRSNVTVTRSPIVKVQGKTITTKDGLETEVDVLILATGFNVAQTFGSFQIYGRNGVNLNDLWDSQTPKTYKTVAINGFPNLFVMLGPGSGLGHNSIVTMIECQVQFAINVMKYMAKYNYSSLEPSEKAQERYSSEIQKKFEGTVWKSGCDSWYINKFGEIGSLWPRTVTSYWWVLRNTNHANDFIGS